MPDNSSDVGQSVLGLNSPAPVGEGYQIIIQVTADGFTVEGPEPLEPKPSDEGQEPTAESEPAEQLPDIATALKHVIAIVKENPIGEDANAQMQAGYAKESGQSSQ